MNRFELPAVDRQAAAIRIAALVALGRINFVVGARLTLPARAASCRHWPNPTAPWANASCGRPLSSQAGEGCAVPAWT